VAFRASKILEILGESPRVIELTKIAGQLHDIGNSINREDHARTGALLSFDILQKMGMPIEEVAEVIAAIGNHHEENGYPVSKISAAIILADKSDVHYSRVRVDGDIENDIHDRVNYAAQDSNVEVYTDRKVFELSIKIDTEIASAKQYFQIFMKRMVMCELAAKLLGLKFEIVINGVRLS